MHAPACPIRVLADELGERFLEAGPDGRPVEALAVTPELTRRDPCRSAVVARAVALSSHHGSVVARVFGTRSTDSGASRLVVRSEWTEGERLSSLVARRQDERRPLSLGQVCYLLGGAVSAVAELHATGPGVCHGALGVSRFVLATDGRVVLRDCVFGGALAALGWPAAQLRDEFGLQVPQLADIPAFTPLTDQFQLGLLAMHLVCGSPSLPTGSAAVAAVFADVRLPGPGGAEVSLPAELRVLVTRMLLLSPDGPFRSLPVLERALDAAIANALDDPPEPPEIAVEQWTVTPPDETGLASEPAAVSRPRPDNAGVRLASGGEATDRGAQSEVRPQGRQHQHNAEVWPVPLRPTVEARPDLAPLAAVPLVTPPIPADAPPAAFVTGLPLAAERHVKAVAAGADWPRPIPTASPTPPVSPGPPAPVRPAPIPSLPAVTPAEPPQASWPFRPPEPSQAGIRLQARPEPGDLYLDAGLDAEFNVPSRVAPAVEEPGRSWTRAIVVALAVLGAVGGLGYYLGGAQALENWRTPPRGLLQLESKPVGATVTVDGVQKGQTPVFLSVAPGSYLVEFSLGDESRAVTVPVEHGAEAYQVVSLYPPGPPGTLEITSVPPGAAVSVDGEPRGTTPLTLSDIAPGEHVVAAESSVARIEETVEVLAGAVVPVTLPLSGFLEVKAPFEVAVFDRARQVGRSSAGKFPLPAGRRLLTFVNEELQYEDDRSVEVPAGRSVRVDLAPPSGTLNFTADTESEVFLDGRPLGSTPLSNVPVSLGSHEVLYRHPKWGEQRYGILVSLGSPARLHAVMATKSITVTRPPQAPRNTRRR